MNKQRMRGIFDPITAAFILAIVGTIATLSLDSGDSVNQDQSQTKVNATETVAVIRNQ